MESVEDLTARHRRERKEFEAGRMRRVKAAGKNKKEKAAVQAQLAVEAVGGEAAGS